MKKILLLSPVLAVLLSGTVLACTPKEVPDACPNIDGLQLVRPDNTVLDDQGNCVDQPPIVPPADTVPPVPPVTPPVAVVTPAPTTPPPIPQGFTGK